MNQMKFPSCHQETIPSAAPALSPPAEPSPPPPGTRARGSGGLCQVVEDKQRCFKNVGGINYLAFIYFY